MQYDCSKILPLPRHDKEFFVRSTTTKYCETATSHLRSWENSFQTGLHGDDNHHFGITSSSNKKDAAHGNRKWNINGKSPLGTKIKYHS